MGLQTTSFRPDKSPAQKRHALEVLRSDFEALRTSSGSVTCWLIYRRPHVTTEYVCQEAFGPQKLDDKKTSPAWFRDGAFFHFVVFPRDDESISALSRFAKRGGAILGRDAVHLFPSLRAWCFTLDDSLWWAALFELASSRESPTLRIEKQMLVARPGSGRSMTYYTQEWTDENGQPLDTSLHSPNGLYGDQAAVVTTIEDAALASHDLAEFLIYKLDRNDGWSFTEPAQLTVTEAAKRLVDVVDGLSLEKARARVCKATRANKFRTNGEKRSKRRIDPHSFSTWLLEQRDSDLDRDNPAHD